MKKLRVGIIGSGRMGERHAEGYTSIPNVELISFADTDLAKSNALATKFKAKAVPVEELIADQSIDAVSICTPNSSHTQPALAAIRAGKHVLIEKPMAISLQDCEAIVKASEENKVNVMVGQTHRFYPSHRKAKEVIDSGAIGKVLLVTEHALDAGALPNKATLPEWYGSMMMGAGVLMEAVHIIDKLRWYLNSELVSVYTSAAGSFVPNSTEQFAMVNYVFADGTSASLTTARHHMLGVMDSFTNIIGERGVLKVRYGEEVLLGKETWTSLPFKHKSSPPIFAHNLAGFIAEMQEFTSSIIERRPPLVSQYDGLASVKGALATYESLQHKRPVYL
jgi:predicted dehydrogenase